MTHPAIISSLRFVAAAALLASAPLAMAHGGSNVSWSVTLGSPGIYAPPPPVVYVQPEPVYVSPAPVYVRPAPVYVQPTTVIRYGQPYYVQPYGYDRPRGHWRHRHDWR